MTFKILTSDTNKVIFRSVVRSAETFDKNQRAEMGRRLHNPPLVDDRNISAPDSEDGNIIQDVPQDPQDVPQGPVSSPDILYDESKQPLKVVTSRHDHSEDDTPLPSMPIMNPEDLVGRTFLLDKQEDEQRFRARIIEAINAHEDDVKNNPELLKFKCSVNNDEFEEILAYNDIIHHIYVDESSDIVWQFKEIVSHEGPLSQNDPRYKGSRYNVKVRWENNEITSEPLKACLLYTSPSPRDRTRSRMPSSA